MAVAIPYITGAHFGLATIFVSTNSPVAIPYITGAHFGLCYRQGYADMVLVAIPYITGALSGQEWELKRWSR